MKRVIKLSLFVGCVIFVILFYSGAFDSYLYYSYCDNPMTYKVGWVDPAFGVPRERFAQELQIAGSVWNSAYSKPLVVFDPQSSLSVNLIYDERQRDLTQLYTAKEEVEKELSAVELSLKQYELAAAKLNAEVNLLNREIAEWNKKPVASEKEYKRLMQAVESVNFDIAQLAKQKTEADNKVLGYNDLINQYNLQVLQYADLLKNLPEEGLYDPFSDKIDIYFYDSPEQFLHTAVHEFGHAVGLGHAQDENALMYPVSNTSTEPSEEDLDLMTNYCQGRAVIKDLIERGRDIISELNLISKL